LSLTPPNNNKITKAKIKKKKKTLHKSS